MAFMFLQFLMQKLFIYNYICINIGCGSAIFTQACNCTAFRYICLNYSNYCV